jgi:hypothetical protein
MNIGIFEIDFGTDGDMYFVTTGGNQISIPNGESLFEKWSDRNGLTHVEREPESDGVESTHREYDKSGDLMRDFAMAHYHLWHWERDGGGAFYGRVGEIDEWYKTVDPRPKQ